MVRARLRILIALVCLPFLVILGRLGSLQLVASVRDGYQRRAEHSSRSFSSPFRGRIFARDGKTLLATNQPVCQLQFRYHDLNPREEPLWTLLDGLEKNPGAPSRDEIERRILDLARPGARAVLPDPESDDARGAADGVWKGEWMLLLENVDAALAAVLERRWKPDAGVFEVRPSASGPSWEVWFQPAKAAQMEITLARIQALLDRAGGNRGASREASSPLDLSHRVIEVLATIKNRVEGEVKKDSDEGVSADRVERKAREVRRYYYGQSWLLLSETPQSVVTEIEYRPWLFPGASCVDSVRRVYPLKEACGTITGFVHRLDAGDEKRLEESGKLIDLPSRFNTPEDFAEARVGGVLRTDWIGEGGLEESYDEELRGLHGMSVVRLNRQGRPGELLPGVPAQDGKDILTTLDAELQKLVYSALELAVRPPAGPKGGSAASAAVMDLESGALLASVGFPGFDPGRMRDPNYAVELESPWGGQNSSRLIDRPSSLPLYPGSVFKIVVAAAAMESARPWQGDFLPDRRYPCHGQFDLIHSLKCDGAEGHTPTQNVDLTEALQFSCNNYFYYLGLKHLGADRIASWAANFGFGRKTGIDLPDRKAQAGKLMAADKASLPWQICHYAIGQGMVEATPLQVLRSYAAIAVGGKAVPKPYLVRPSEPDPLVLQNPRTVEVIREGLWRVGHAPGGTAARSELRLSRFNAAYKTGTAEVKRGDDMLNHGWLAGFAPFDKPRIAFVAVVEETPRHGSEVAGPVVEKILAYFAEKEPALYLLDSKKDPRKDKR